MLKNKPSQTHFNSLLTSLVKLNGAQLADGLKKLSLLPLEFSADTIDRLLSAIIKLSATPEYLEAAVNYWQSYMTAFSKELKVLPTKKMIWDVVPIYSQCFAVISKQLKSFKKSSLANSNICIEATDILLQVSVDTLIGLLNALQELRGNKDSHKETLGILTILIDFGKLLENQPYSISSYQKLLTCKNEDIKTAIIKLSKDYLTRSCQNITKSTIDWQNEIDKKKLTKEYAFDILKHLQCIISNFYEWQDRLLSSGYLGNLEKELKIQNMLKSSFTLLCKIHDNYEQETSSLTDLIEAIRVISVDYFIEFLAIKSENKDEKSIEIIFNLLKEKNDNFFTPNSLSANLSKLLELQKDKKEFLIHLAWLEKYISDVTKILKITDNSDTTKELGKTLFSDNIRNKISFLLISIFKNSQEQEIKNKIAALLFHMGCDIGKLQLDKISRNTCNEFNQALSNEAQKVLFLLSQKNHEVFVYGEKLRAFLNQESCSNTDIVTTNSFDDAVELIKNSGLAIHSENSLDNLITVVNHNNENIKIYCAQPLANLYKFSKKLNFSCNSLFYDQKNNCIYDSAVFGWKDLRSKMLSSLKEKIYIQDPSIIFYVVRFVALGYSLSNKDKEQLEHAINHFSKIENLTFNKNTIIDITSQLSQLFLDGRAKINFEKIIKLNLLKLLLGRPTTEEEINKITANLMRLDEEYNNNNEKPSLKTVLLMFYEPLNLDNLDNLMKQGLLGVIANNEKLSINDSFEKRWLMLDILYSSTSPDIIIKTARALAQLTFHSPDELLVIGKNLIAILYDEKTNHPTKIEAVTLLGKCAKAFQDIVKELDKPLENKKDKKLREQKKQATCYLEKIKELRKDVKISLITIVHSEDRLPELQETAYKALSFIYQYEGIFLDKYKKLLFFSEATSPVKDNQNQTTLSLENK